MLRQVLKATKSFAFDSLYLFGHNILHDLCSTFAFVFLNINSSIGFEWYTF